MATCGAARDDRAPRRKFASGSSAWRPRTAPGAIRGFRALANLDHHVSRGTIANILRQHGIEPVRERQKRTTWQEFLRTHRGVLAAADFFTVEVWTTGGLTPFAVLFVIDLATVEITGLLREPDSAWVIQCGRQLTDPVDGCMREKRFPLHARDPRFTDAKGGLGHIEIGDSGR